ncbi:Uncharacterized protein ALO68_04316 [Pseudomonas syringae pv. helianthi]|uniref:Uncharacterized protein n=2 Tax=Pseudomonas syringae group genomosp. 7 TaxID=251699 RepID=A0A0N8RLC2_9PSED|nr:Uncharacterized protein ALO68_04316 [Pseudomonas syringae pv. helianthi]KPY82961.1 Uncharacterized protein ALO44_01463 [Pseudomonas syringae pv. tagetis]RMR04824.1 hypothetical protein ALP93_00253 [Pseudomonas syringae pv. helianthi]RMV47838.1 hypothetical protein ALP10_02180 [Pseudomonas syringae pv. helianthi]RMW19739.1 hypothetical protein ALO98_01068 [Pseudomonas syringae pv. tagetis]
MSAVASLDEKKLEIELKKLQLEQRKLDLDEQRTSLASKGYRIDLVAKLAIPAAVLVLAAATYYTNTNNNDARMAFDTSRQKMEFMQKQEDLFMKRSDAERNQEENKARFIQNNLELITDHAPEAEQKFTLLAKAVLPGKDVEDVLEKARAIRVGSTSSEIEADKASPLKAAIEYIATGKKFVKAGNFEQALVNFQMANLLNTSNPLAWNYQAYAQMRTDRNDDALKSISTAINLKPTDAGAQKTIMINATKILCSLGRTDDALSYINKSIALAPRLVDDLRKDEEFKNRCGFVLPG